MPKSTAVILLAGGSGSRMGGDQAKQFIRVAGKPVLVHSFEALRAALPDAYMVVVTPRDDVSAVQAMLRADAAHEVVAGGTSRQGSTFQGLKALRRIHPDNVIIHDAARPFVSGQIIHDVVDALQNNEAVDVAIPTADTIIVERDNYIQNIPKRAHIMRGQTPQAFRFQALIDAYRELGEDQLDKFTDDCGIYLECNPFGRVRIVRGHEENFKITNPIDLVLADEMFRIRASQASPDLPGIDLRDKRALVFGGTAGIGKALVQIMLDAGAKVISRSRSNGCDISSESDVRQATADAEAALGGLDFVVNTAGLLGKGKLQDASSADLTQQLAINLAGAVWVAKAAHAPLKDSKGMLLLYSSSSYTRGRADYVVYSATKAAIVNMTQGLAEEWSEDGIQVNCIVPGRTDTEMRRANFANEAQASLCNPYDIALKSARVLCTPFSGHVVRV
jgi:2-C-methyl-D-erythritol 4-phosphate cytidylyltransferase